MSDSFFSVTVVGRRRRMDVSLPADVPVAELLGELAGMLDEQVDGAPPSWSLVRVGGQVLDGELGLAVQGVSAGGVLFLRELASPDAAQSLPAVDDYAGAVAAAIEAAPGLWTPARLQGLFVAAGVTWMLALGALAVVEVAQGVIDGAPLFLLAAVVAAVGGGVAGRLAGYPLTGAALALAALPLWWAAGAGFARVAGLDDLTAVAVGLVAVAAGALGARLAAHEANALAAGVLAATLPGALTLGVCAWRGAPLASGAAVLVPLTLAGLRLLPWAVARLTGLEGEREGGAIGARALEARRLLGALGAGAAVTLAAGCVVLAAEPGGWAHSVAIAGALAALLQARRGRLTVDVAPMVLVGLATLATFELPFATAVLRQPDQVQGPAVLLGTTAALVVLGLLARRRRLPVGVRRQLGRAEALAAAATVPLALGMLGLYAAAQAFAARFA
jgi:type VII secretion integral membrane protein EccD